MKIGQQVSPAVGKFNLLCIFTFAFLLSNFLLTFFIPQQVLALTKPIQLSPAKDAQISTAAVTFSWSHPYNDQYELKIKTKGGTLKYASGKISSKSKTVDLSKIPLTYGSTYKWYVVVYANGQEDSSDDRWFTYKFDGYCSVSSGVTISTNSVKIGQNFNISFTLKERRGAPKTFENVAIAILRSDNSFVFDFAMYSNITIPANGTWSQTATNKIYATQPAGTYKAVVRGKYQGAWFDFDTIDAGVNPRSFYASGILPGTISVNPTTGSWTTSPKNVSVGSSNASRIYYTIRTTTDGSTPANPPEPSSGTNDGSISGDSGTFQVYASAGQYKKLKVRFRGYNSNGYGVTSGSFSYSIDLRAAAKPGLIYVNPTTGSWTTSPKDVSVSSSNATRIYYTIRTTTDGSTPANPPYPSSDTNDGSISGSSGNFQLYASAGEYKKLKVRFRGYNSNEYGLPSGSFSYTIDLRAAAKPGSVSASPTSGSWTTSPKNVSVGSSNASRIYYTIRTTTDGSTPANPPEPSSGTNDGSISGDSGTFQVYASAGQYKKLKVRFRGYNSNGYGVTSGSFSYSIDLRAAAKPGLIYVNPTTGSWTTSPKDVSVSSSNATRIYYTIRTTTDGSTPANPPYPSSDTNDGSISGSSGNFQLYASAGEYKKLKVRFRGYNSNEYGLPSGSFSYTIDLRAAAKPGSVSASPTSGSWTTSPKNVSVGSSNASRIYYTIRTTTDGSTPANPPEPSSGTNDGSISGDSGTFQVYASAGQYKKLKVRFRGYNSNGYGVTSGSFSYSIDLRAAAKPGLIYVNPTSGSWTTSPKDVSVSSSNATRIYYTIRTTTDGSTPANPPYPSSDTNDGSISGSSGNFQLYASAGEYKKLKVRFRGYNSNEYGLPSGSFSYTIDLRAAAKPGSVSASPTSGSWTSSPKNVSVGSSNATRIYYTIRTTTDGSTPATPPEPTSGTNDGSISGASGTFQVYASAGEYKKLKVRFRGYNSNGYGVTSGSYTYSIDLRAAATPGFVSVNPTSGSWTTSPRDVSVSCSNASRIYYTIRTTTDGSTPATPPEPSSGTNDGSISGASGTFQVYASAGEYKKLKVRFRGYNSNGYGVTSGSYTYSIDLRAAATPGFVSVNPTSGSWTTSPRDVSVSCSNASRIYYTIRTTTDGSTPATPPEPSSGTNDGSISGASGTFQVYANAGDYKKLKVRFRGYNSNGYGETSGSFSYTIDRRGAAKPGTISVNPTSGSWTTSPRNVNVSCSNASRIYYTIRTTTDGSTPATPPEPSSGTNEGSISGDSGTFQVYASSGQYKKLKVRFRGYNSSGYGETSGSFSYTIDLRTSGIESPGAVSINPTIGSWTSSPRNVNVSCSNATRIYYTIRATTDSSTPADPPEPSSDTNDGSISGGSGTFEVYASAGQYKQLKVRFRGYNGSGYGVTSGSFFYTIDRRSVVKPGTVSVNPGNGNWDSSPKNVSVCSTNASIIFYTISATTNGSTPADPPEPSLNIHDGYIFGAYGNFQVFAREGQYKKLKVRFRGYNSSGYGATSGSFSYTIDRRSSALPIDDHGNNRATATLITLSYNTGKSSGSLTAGDYDYFRIAVPLSGTMTVYTTGNTDTYGYLLTSGDTILRSNDDESNNSENFRISQSLPAGTYYVAVRHRDLSNGTGNYTLNVQFDRSDSGSVKDDHGNDCPQATNIPLANGSGSRSGFLSVGDKDYFRIDVPKTGTLTVFTKGNTDTYGYLKNSSCTTIDDNDDSKGSHNFRMSQSVGAGTYYVEVRHYNMSTGTGDYTLNVDFENLTAKPGAVSVNPTSGSWATSPRDLSVSCSNASRIYYTIQTTTDGSTPATPPEPTSSVNDGSISGASGTFQVYANPGEYKKLKVRFRGYNNSGYGASTGSFSYSIDLRNTINNASLGLKNAENNLNKNSGNVSWNGTVSYGVWADGTYTYCARFVRMCLGEPAIFLYAIDMYNYLDRQNLINRGQNPPAGAVVFYSAHADENWNYGHTGIADGKGFLYSVTSKTTGVNLTPVAGYFKATYLGYVTASTFIANH